MSKGVASLRSGYLSWSTFEIAAVGGWGDASLDLGGALLDVFTGREHTGPVRIDDVFRDLPVALLVRC